MFLEFDHGLWLRVHLGLYGAWDFAGDIAGGGDGRGVSQLDRCTAAHPAADVGVGEVRRRPRDLPARADRAGAGASAEPDRGRRPARPDGVRGADGRPRCRQSIDKLGPDPLVDDSPLAEERFVTVVRKKPTPIALLLMDQSVVSGIGNVYRAEMLFRARQNPFTPGRDVREEVRARRCGATGCTCWASGSTPASCTRWTTRRRAIPNPEHWVYQRTGEPCRDLRHPDRHGDRRRSQALLVPHGSGLKRRLARSDARPAVPV